MATFFASSLLESHDDDGFSYVSIPISAVDTSSSSLQLCQFPTLLPLRVKQIDDVGYRLWEGGLLLSGIF